MTEERQADEVVVTVGRLIVHVTGYRRLVAPEPGSGVVEVDLTVHNPPGEPGSTRRLPAVELRDGEGHAYEAVDVEGIAEPVRPTAELRGHARFRVPEAAHGLTLVFAPGYDEEAEVGLTP